MFWVLPWKCAGRGVRKRQVRHAEGEKVETHTGSLGARQTSMPGEGQHKHVWWRPPSRWPNPACISQLSYFLAFLWHLVLPVAFIFRNIFWLSFGDVSYWYPFSFVAILFLFLLGSFSLVLPFKCRHPAMSVHGHVSLILISGQAHSSVLVVLATSPPMVLTPTSNLHFCPCSRTHICRDNWTPSLICPTDSSKFNIPKTELFISFSSPACICFYFPSSSKWFLSCLVFSPRLSKVIFLYASLILCIYSRHSTLRSKL